MGWGLYRFYSLINHFEWPLYIMQISKRRETKIIIISIWASFKAIVSQKWKKNGFYFVGHYTSSDINFVSSVYLNLFFCYGRSHFLFEILLRIPKTVYWLIGDFLSIQSFLNAIIVIVWYLYGLTQINPSTAKMKVLWLFKFFLLNIIIIEKQDKIILVFFFFQIWENIFGFQHLFTFIFMFKAIRSLFCTIVEKCLLLTKICKQIGEKKIESIFGSLYWICLGNILNILSNWSCVWETHNGILNLYSG